MNITNIMSILNIMNILWIYSMTWKNVAKIVVTFEPIIQFWCPSRFRILIPTLFYEREKKRKTLTIWPLGWVGLGVTVTYVYMTVLKAAYWLIASPVSQLQLYNFCDRNTNTPTDMASLWPTSSIFDTPISFPVMPSVYMFQCFALPLPFVGWHISERSLACVQISNQAIPSKYLVLST